MTAFAFTKMSGAGNDFVVVDNRDRRLTLQPQQIAHLCHRQFGVGADGLLLVEPGTDGCDFTMRYYNADGSAADMCGNGARCFARFVRPFKNAEQVSFLTGAGRIDAAFTGDDVRINLTPPHNLHTGLIITTSAGVFEIHSLNTGVPHAVLFVPDADQAMVGPLGREIRQHVAFEPKGTNVNFVQITGPDSIRVRTYERGVEAETLACGTGVTASAILAHQVKNITRPVAVTVQSGARLHVDFQPEDAGQFRHVTLQGPANIVFRGEIELP